MVSEEEDDGDISEGLVLLLLYIQKDDYEIFMNIISTTNLICFFISCLIIMHNQIFSL